MLMAFICREDRIRTCDPLVPNQVRYRPALLPDPSGTTPEWGCKYKGFRSIYTMFFKTIILPAWCKQ